MGYTTTDNYGISEYQNRLKDLQNKINLPNDDYKILIYALGLSEESGEVAGLIKRQLRGDFEHIDLEKLTLELGDILAYLTMLASFYNIKLDDIVTKNLQKISSRIDRNTINGMGDYR